MDTFTIYIGSNNRTHRLETAKIKEILSRRHEGFTIQTGTGFWRGMQEKTAIVTLAAGKPLMMKSVQELKIELKQEAVAYQVAPQMVFV